MTKFILDTSVVVKWAFQIHEEGEEDAKTLYTLMAKKKVRLIAPSFLLIELLNILMKKKHVRHADAKVILERILESGIEFLDVSFLDKAEAISGIVRDNDVSAYDALFLLTSRNMQCPLVTFDAALLRIKKSCISIQEALHSL